MPEYDIRLPDGRTVTVRAADPEAAQAGVRDWWAKQQPAPEASAAQTEAEAMPSAMDAMQMAPDANVADVAAKVGQGFFLNWGDEIAATAGALPNIVSGGRWGRDRATILAELRERERKLEAEHPGLAAGAEVAGVLGSSLIGGGALAGRAAPTIAGTMGRAAATAAPRGAVDALGKMEGESTTGEKLTRAASGAGIAGLTAGAVGGLGQVAGRVIAPIASEAARHLTARGVHLTPAEVLGVPALTRMEDAAASTMPVIGSMIRQRAAEGVDSLNRAAYRDVLAPIYGPRAERAMRGAETGHDAINRLNRIFSHRYRRVVPRMSAATDDPLHREITQIMGDLPRDAQGRFAEAVDRYVNNLVDQGTGRIPGDRLQGALEGLRERAKAYSTSISDPTHKDIGSALTRVRESLLASAERHSPPDAVAAYRRVQDAYRRFRPVRDAASRVSSNDGTFSPAILHNAVRAADSSTGKGAAARGEAALQGLSGPARATMTPKAAGSPTAERLAWAGLGGALTGVGTGAVDPYTAGGMLLLGLPPAVLYSRRGSRAFQRYATNPRRGPVRAAISNATIRSAPGIGMLAEREIDAD